MIRQQAVVSDNGSGQSTRGSALQPVLPAAAALPIPFYVVPDLYVVARQSLLVDPTLRFTMDGPPNPLGRGLGFGKYPDRHR